MKTILTIVITLFTICMSFSQETVGERVVKNAKDKTYQRGEQKSDETVDGALNKVEEGIKGIFKKKDKKKKQESAAENQETKDSGIQNSSSENSSTKRLVFS